MSRAALGAYALCGLALCSALAACDEHRRATPAAAAVSAQVAAARSSQPSAALPAASELGVPPSQMHAVADLRAGERRPLLIFLHGLGSSGRAAFEGLALGALGERERVFVLAPDGARDRAGRQFWNAGPSCCNFDHAPLDDVTRLGALIDAWRARPGIDAQRIYLAGHSNGGFMVERLVCALGDRIAAAASLSGAAPAESESCSSLSHVALLELHGDADAIVRYEGGSVFDSSALAPFPAIPQGFRAWGKRLGCAGEPSPGADLDLDPRLPGAETRVEAYSACPLGAVTLWTVRGGGHTVGTDARAFDAVWRFLAAHQR